MLIRPHGTFLSFHAMLIFAAGWLILRRRLALLGLVIAVFSGVPSNPLFGKEIPLLAIELYDGPDGVSYAFISNVLINGKAELRSCTFGSEIDRSEYGRLAKVGLSAGSTLDYGRDGVLRLTRGAASVCVVPSNLKMEKGAPLTAADLAKRSELQGRVLPESAPPVAVIPPLQPGVSLVFVSEPSPEMAEYLRAQRASTILIWESYLSKYPAGNHAPVAKAALVSLYVKNGEEVLAVYRSSAAGGKPSYQDLKQSRLRAKQALDVSPRDPGAVKLADEVSAELRTLTDRGVSELDAYKAAVVSHSAGYSHLLAARDLANAIVDIDPQQAPGRQLLQSADSEYGTVEAKMGTAESLAASGQLDDAMKSINGYLAFAGEQPRIARVVDDSYQFHFDRGSKAASAKDWQVAVDEFQKAADIKSTDPVAASLGLAKNELMAQRNRAAADSALTRSHEYAQQRMYIKAYETLTALPAMQRALVADEIQRLEPFYIESASQTAKDLQRAHDPIRGLVDEVGMQQAYEYLQHAYDLSSNGIYYDRMTAIANKLSDYYLQQAKRYMDRPLGSGAGLAWSYLEKAKRYKAANLSAIHDEITKCNSAYQMRSQLSIRVTIRDSTSRRESSGFAEQLADAIATGLETSGLPVKVIRPNEKPELEPNYFLIGDVLQHRHSAVPTSEPKESKYRAGQHEIPNPEWNRENLAFESANLELQSAQHALEGAAARGKKKEIAAANQRAEKALQKVQEERAKVDSIPKTIPTDRVKPYTYTQKTIDLGASVQLQFLIKDVAGNEVCKRTPVTREVHKSFVVLENVKPEDTEEVRVQGTIPDEIQFLTDVENDARDALIKAAYDAVAALPAKILEQARKKFADGDLEGAAEGYILYLNATPGVDTIERQKAMQFLQEQFNIRRSKP